MGATQAKKSQNYDNIYIHKTEIIQNAGEIFPSVEGSSRPEHHNTENTLSVKTEVIQNAGKILSSVPDEIAYDPYKLYLYNKAIRKGKEKERVLRINIIGNYGQGKTSLARSITGQNSFDVTSTNGIEINRYACKRISGGSIVVNNSNNDDQDIINRIASVALTVRPTSSALELGSLVNELRTLGENVENPIRNLKQEPAPLVSKRTERKPKQEIPFSKTDLEVFADVLEKQKNNHDKILDIWDFGGQYIFYATHTLFHSKKALYLLVFDLTSPLDKIIHDEEFPDETGVRSMAYFAKYWIESIDAYTGPDTQVILVGTHKDLLANPELEKDEYFEHVRSLFDSTDGSNENQLIFHIQPEDFAVDNKNSPQSGIKELKEFLLKKHQELTQTIEIPARWIQLEKALNEHRKKKIITFQDVINIDKDNKHSIDDVDQIKLFLSYHHDKGTLFYFDEDQPSDPVVLDTKFLIDAFKCIITSEQFVKKSGARSEWKRLKNEGILSEKLVDIVWSKSEEFKPHKAVLLKYLKKHNILSQIVRLDQSTGCWKEENLYIVPSLLRDITDAEDTMRLFQENKHQSRLRYVLKFSRLSIVHVVYNRIVAASLGIWPLANFCNMHLIFEHVCVLEMLETSENKSTNHVAVIELRQECGTIELRLLNLLPQEIRRDLADQLRRFVESFVTQEFRKINCYQTENVKLFSRAYRCNHEDHKTDGGSIRLKELLENENLRCPDNYTHDRDFYRNAQCEWFEEATDEDEYPDIELTEKHFSLLSQAIGKNWELLGPLLEIRQTSMQHIKLDFPHSSSMQIFKMLCNWRDIVGEKATLDVLVNTFLMCPEVSFEWDIVRNIKDEFYRNNREKKPGFIKPVTDKICALGENLTLNCKVNKPISEVTWKKNGRALIQDERTKTFVNGYWHTLLIENVKKNDAATYECVFGNAVTQCDVKVQESDIQLEFTQKLVDKEVGSIARTVEFSCELNKDVEEVKWYFKKERILPSDKHRILSKGASHKLRIRDVTEKDEGKYLVEVEGKTSEAWLYVEDTEEERKLLLEHYKRQKGKEKSTDKRFGTVRTLYHCTADNESELSFGPNEIIRNVRPSIEPGWLEGTLDGKVGLIPENYVEFID